MNSINWGGRRVRVLLLGLAGVGAVMLMASAPALAAPWGQCVTAHVDAPFRLPDGLLYPAGSLTLCDGGAYSPVDSFQRILVGGSTIGLFVSDRRGAEIRSMGLPQIVFNRDADGNLTLIGYTLPSSGRSVAFRLKTQDEAWQASARRQLGVDSAPPVAASVATTGTR